MCRKTVLRTIDLLQDEHCNSCSHMKGKSPNQVSKAYNSICKNCVIGKQIIELGKSFASGEEKRHAWGKEESFYAIHHIDVLGLERGIEQVANRLEIDVIHVEAHYFRQKEKAHHTYVV